MTLPAVDHDRIRGLEGAAYKVGPHCSNPKCGSIAEHAHHIVRRSALGGPFDWVEIEDVVVGNKTGLCYDCHNDVTGKINGHRAAIRWERDHREFWWSLLSSLHGQVTYHLVDPIRPQPPTPESLVEWASGEADHGSELCPACGQRKRRRPAATVRVGRRRKTWIVKVPDDAEENGADVLDTLIEELAPLIPNADSSSTGRYYALVPVLYYALQNPDNFVETMAGVGG